MTTSNVIAIPPPNLPSVTRAVDGLMNVVTGLGTAQSKRQSNVWVYDLLNHWQQLDAAYQTNWIARQCVDVPAQDMTREWRQIKSKDAEAIEEYEKWIGLSEHVQDALTWSRLFGGAGVLMLTGQDLTKPLNLNMVKKDSLERLLVFDRWDMSALTLNTWDVLAPNYLMPEFYNIQGGAQAIHWTHFARFIGEKLPRRQMVKTQGWGDSVLRKCLADVSDMVAAKDGIANLMQEANVDVINRTGLSEELSSDQDDMIIKRYDFFQMTKSNLRLALLDGEEEYNRHTLNLSGVAPIIENFMTWISGASRIPVTKLFGTSAKGLNATGEGDLQTYYDDIRAMQKNHIVNPLRTIDEVLVRSAVGSFPDDFDYVFNPLQQVDQVEVAQAQLLNAQRDQVYEASGIIQKSQVQAQLQAGEVYQFEEGAIEELAELENSNMFEELPDLENQPDEPEDDQTFVDTYRALIDAGMTHDAIMMKLENENLNQ